MTKETRETLKMSILGGFRKWEIGFTKFGNIVVSYIHDGFEGEILLPDASAKELNDLGLMFLAISKSK